ncbi:MAG: nicotinate-nucleotide diphosphorylase (carboxylating) [SAR86 cluster bacterium]|uniref:Probable nicotinate-nucleotide pyrophosphorylase [carboxylating] n=1 Tax=SAR86 cluster bacterium TaxID=2030880 RepID=A0A2A4XH61_9GAMM|nr:MAG: nicotinate-nucleotide diphosphorylase (carboxylating) [SAR86 cluster bacterium]
MPPTVPVDIAKLVTFCLQEDIGAGDITAELIPIDKSISAKLISRDNGIFCGRPWADEVFQQVDSSLTVNWNIEEGAELSPNKTLVQIVGSARSILTAERTVLNFLQTLSAVSTMSQHYASLVEHTSVKLLDTRKTLPSLRSAQKYAVRIGGCFNHRMGLFDAFLIKENHIAACGGIDAAVSKAKALYPNKPVEIEVQNLNELELAISAEADIVMLDNFDRGSILKAVKLNGGRLKLEASGGIDADRLVSIAETGVDYISLGALTKNCRATDLSLLIE